MVWWDRAASPVLVLHPGKSGTGRGTPGDRPTPPPGQFHLVGTPREVLASASHKKMEMTCLVRGIAWSVALAADADAPFLSLDVGVTFADAPTVVVVTAPGPIAVTAVVAVSTGTAVVAFGVPCLQPYFFALAGLIAATPRPLLVGLRAHIQRPTLFF